MFWKNHQQEIVNQAKNETLDLAIDGQCDSPGFNATYCTVSSMDIKTDKILDYQIVDVKEVNNSQGNVSFSFTCIVESY